MQRFRNVIIALAAVVMIGFIVALAVQHAWALNALHVLHLLIALNVLKWIGAGTLLAVLAIRRILKSRKAEVPAGRNGGAVQLPGAAPDHG